MKQNPRVGAVGLAGMSVFLQVDHFHASGETLHADNLYCEMGGKAINQAVAAKRMGVNATFFGAVGDDDNGRQCRDFLIQEGLTPCLEKLPDIATAYACILTDKHGENRVSVYAGAAAHLSGEYIRSQEQELRKCDMLLLGLECPWEATLAALEIANTCGIPVILNPAPAQEMSTDILKQFQYLTPNAQEAALLLGIPQTSDTAVLCDALEDRGFPPTIVTMGSKGAMLWDGKTGILFAAPSVKAVDTTGAGDCFNAALVASLSQGIAIEQAVRIAVCASAESVQKSYVMPSLPLRSQIPIDPDVPSTVIWQSAK